MVFCDIEGYEEVLLNPEKVPNLKYVDLLIESHDCFVPNISENLVNRFIQTHAIEIVIDYPCRFETYATPKQCSKDQMELITNEKRPSNMKFIFMKSFYEKI